MYYYVYLVQNLPHLIVYTKLKSIMVNKETIHGNVWCRLSWIKLYFDLTLNRNITLDDSENHTFYKSVGPKYLVDNPVVGSDVDIKRFKWSKT